MNLTGTQRLETHRLVLRPYRYEDADDMFENWASDPEVTRFLTWPAHSSVEVSQNVLKAWIPHYEEDTYFNWAIEWKETGHVIGNIAVVAFDQTTQAANLGYCLGRAFWGRGIMPEAIRAVMDYLFDVVGVNRVAAEHDILNPKSGRAMDKAGMHEEGILRGAGLNNQGVCDTVWHAQLRSDRKSAKEKKAAAATVRFAHKEDLEQVNVLRRQVNDLHVAGEPEVFKAGFCDVLRDYIYENFQNPMKEIVVAELDGRICGYAVLHHIIRPENPFMYERYYLEIDEFGVDENVRRSGVASAMISYIRDYAKAHGFNRVELDMWEFNQNALAFYEAAGFTTYRRYMKMPL